jgi:hypothetical protein
MPYREIIAVCSENHTKHTMWAQNVELLDVKTGGTYSDRWDFKGLKANISAICVPGCYFRGDTLLSGRLHYQC